MVQKTGKTEQAGQAVQTEQAVLLPFGDREGVCAKCGKPLIGGKAGDVGRVCKEHEGKMGAHYVQLAHKPEEGKFETLSSACRRMEQEGKTARFAVKRTGGDGGVNPPTKAIYQIYVWEGRKYMQAGATNSLLEELKAGK